MLETFLKYFIMIVCALFIFKKLLNLTKHHILYSLFFALSVSTLINCIKNKYPYMSVITILLLSIIFLKVITKTGIELTITATILSYGISYAIFTLSSITISALFYILGLDRSVNLLYAMIPTVFLQIILTIFLFKFKRLRKGMPFLNDKNIRNTGVFISIVILSNTIIVNNSKHADFIYTLPVILIIFCGIFILLWWRGRLTHIYLARLKEAEINDLKNMLKEKDSIIKNLKADNDSLAKIIHKDNKMIPAMEFALRNYFVSSIEKKENNLLGDRHKILALLEAMSQERAEIIKNYGIQIKKLPLTNIYSIDVLLNYMGNKAREENISFDFVISGDINCMITNIISETHLNTLLADLIDNAIVATKNCYNKNILVNIGKADNSYFIDVIDSGVYFDAETILQLGLKKITTHQNDGGSGIGLKTTFDFLQTYNASFIIDEFYNNNIFTKKVSIKFDTKKQYILKTNRKNELKKLIKRKDLIIEEC